MRKVFVTGANGFLGTNLVLMLIEQGYSVCALVRHRNRFVKPQLENLQLVEGSLQNRGLLKEYISQCQYVVHIAACTSQNLLKLEDYYATNVQGTQNIIDACIENHVKKLVYIGTANTYGYGSKLNPGHEGLPMRSPFTQVLYALSKNQAQCLIDDASRKLNSTTISPTFMLGAYDTKPSSGRIIQMAKNKRVVFHPSGGKNFVHVADVATAVIKAFEIPTSGIKLILANENLSYREFFSKVVKLNNQKTFLIQIPNFVLQLVGLLGDLLRAFHIKTDISTANIHALTIHNYYTNQKAKQELEIEFTPIDKAILDSLNYFKKDHLESKQ